jgi:uncharacterized protein with HEPN domain
MQPRTRKQLDDVRDAAAFIIAQTQSHSAQTYAGDRLLRQAVERNFEIIGEAMNRLRSGDPTVASQITDANRIVVFRNVLIHGYHVVDDAEVWRVIVNSLPILLREVEALYPPGARSRTILRGNRKMLQMQISTEPRVGQIQAWQ